MQTGPIFHERNSYRRPLIIAHRGCNNYAPQNSLPAFEVVANNVQFAEFARRDGDAPAATAAAPASFSNASEGDFTTVNDVDEDLPF